MASLSHLARTTDSLASLVLAARASAAADAAAAAGEQLAERTQGGRRPLRLGGAPAVQGQQ
eukprot:6194019-Pleurochrysis_carterae.AAC.3